MIISIEDIEKAIKEIFGEAKIYNTNSVYESIDNSDNLKLVIFFNKLYYEQTSCLYTKLIFVSDPDKVNLSKNSFLYLYDINCIYQSVDFEDIENFKKKLSNIFNKEKFGKNIKILSKFVENPASLINNWLYENKVKNISVMGFKYDPKVDIVPCKSLSFSFALNINETEIIELTINKEGKGLYVYDFKFNDENIKIEKQNLDTLVETISNILKNKLTKE
jgi:hypothetical protein